MKIFESPKIPMYEMFQGGTETALVYLASRASLLGTSLSSTVWSVDEGQSVSLSGSPSITNNTVTHSLVASGTNSGTSQMKVAATMADGQIVNKFFRVNVLDPNR